MCGRMWKSPSARKVWIEIIASQASAHIQMSPSARKVWIEIANVCTTFPTVFRHLPQGRCGLKSFWMIAREFAEPSPSARKVWIEIKQQKKDIVASYSHLPQGRCGLKLPPMPMSTRCAVVTFRKEGVD